MSNKVIDFGKHKGKDYQTICCSDPTYLAWAAAKGLAEQENPYVQWSIRAKDNGVDCPDDYDYRMDYCNE